jgi:hypothetical protein
MTPEQARRRAARRIRRRRRRLITRALFIIPALLGGAVLTADVVEVSRDPAAVAPLPPPRALRTGPRPRRLPVPIPVFHPSIRLDALELEIPELDPLDLELRDPKLERALAKRRLARAEKQPQPPKDPTPPKKPASPEESATKRARGELIQMSAVQPHLLELIPPRPFVDPSAVVVIPEPLPSPEPWWPLGWPGSGWIDFPLDPSGGIDLVKPLPGAKDKDDDEEEEKPPPIIPEPGTAVLLLLGLAALGVARRCPSRNPAG